MKKSATITILLVIIGWSVGLFLKSITSVPENEGWEGIWSIPRYDFYDYEEAILKEGNITKYYKILMEPAVDRFPYMIVMYDVYHCDVSEDLLDYYSGIRWRKKYNRRQVEGNTPIRNFVKEVLMEENEKGKEQLEKFTKYEKKFAH